MSNIRSISLLESFETYEGHGEIKIDMDLFPELVGKTDKEIDEWLNVHYCDLFVDSNSSELRKEKDPNDDDVIELSEYWNNCEVVWDKIKNETKTMKIK